MDRVQRPLPDLRRRALTTAVFFVLGLATVFIALGAGASALGQALARYKDSLAVAGGALILLFGLHFLGVLRIPLLYREARMTAGSAETGTLLGSYLMGLAFAFGWTPCIGPILSAILFQASQAESLARGVGLLAAYAAGLGIPFLVAALFIGSFLDFVKRFRRSLHLVERAMGLLLVVVGVMFLTGGFQTASGWLLENMPLLANIESAAATAAGAHDPAGGGGLNVGYFVAFLGGVLSFLSPCVLPLAPPYLAYLAGVSLDHLEES